MAALTAAEGLDMSQLVPMQMCFVVDDVQAAVDYTEKAFGWGPFSCFTADVPGEYKGWQGQKITHVALGMAGPVQMEFLHMDAGKDAVASYQAQYGTGFQHLGVRVSSRDEAIALLEGLGASVDQLNEYPGVKFAFIDLPTGPAMFELLQREGENEAISKSTDNFGREAKLPLDRATLVTADMVGSLRFMAGAFDWGDVSADSVTLRYGDKECECLRYVGRAGGMDLELVSPLQEGEDPFSKHLQRGDHGLVYAGGQATLLEDEGMACEWLQNGESLERFRLLDWQGGGNALAIRSA
jgi:hypothetical protein